MNNNISLPNFGPNYRNFFSRFLDVPHLLIAGTTGSGKSVFLNGLIYTAMQERFPFPKIKRGCAFIFLDAKRTELAVPGISPHCVYYAKEEGDMLTALHIAIGMCNQRAKELEARNRKNLERDEWEDEYFGGNIYVVIDEFADLVTNKKIKNDVFASVQKIAQIGRAQKVHLWLCTQTVKATIIPTEITNNINYRMGLRVNTALQSKLIIDTKGLEAITEDYGHGIFSSPKGLERIDNIPFVPRKDQIKLSKYWREQIPEMLLEYVI